MKKLDKGQSRHDYELKRAYALIERMVARYSDDEKREMFQVGGPELRLMSRETAKHREMSRRPTREVVGRTKARHLGRESIRDSALTAKAGQAG